MKNKKFVLITLIFVLSISLILVSLIFSSSIEIMLRLKPNLMNISDNAFEVHFIDVGQGDAVAIRLPNNKTILIDSGPNYSEDVLEEYLNKVFFTDNYDTFDYVFLSHSDIDHSGNMKFILDNYTVKNFCRPPIFSANLESYRAGYGIDDNEVYDEILLTLQDKNITTFFASNATINTGAGTIDMYLNPVIYDETKTNECSYAIVISSNSAVACFSGDLGEDAEGEMVYEYALPDVDLYKLAHHGSKYSNSYEFLSLLQPEYVACCVGDNLYGHPASDTLLRLALYDEEYGKSTYETFKSTLHDGNIVYYVNSDSEDMKVLTINNIGDYVFVDWYIIVIVGCFVLVGVYVLYVFTGKFKINIKIKNMKR